MADFTELNPHAICDRCNVSFKKEELQYVVGRVRGTGQRLCLVCKLYYSVKANNSNKTLSAAELQDIAQQVAKGQHGDSKLKVQAVGRPFHSLWDIHTPSSSMGPPPLPRPQVLTPASINAGSMLPFPRINSDSFPQFVGYQQAHTKFNELRAHFAKLAYAHGGTGKITVSVRLATWIPDKKNGLKPISEPRDLQHVSPDIGVDDLKSMAIIAIWESYCKWSHDYPISFSSLGLRDADWHELVPIVGMPAPFRSQFTNAKGKFNPKKGLHIFVSIPHHIYIEILNYRDTIAEQAAEKEDEESSHHPPVIVKPFGTKTTQDSYRSSSHKPPMSAQQAPGTMISKRVLNRDEGTKHNPVTIPSSSDDDEDQPEDQPSTPPRKIPQRGQESPDIKTVRAALRAQESGTRGSARSKYNTEEMPCIVFVAPRTSWKDLISTPSIVQLEKNVTPKRVSIFVNPKGEAFRGTFKSARFGHVSTPIFPTTSSYVCIKQAFYEKPDGKLAYYSGAKQSEILDKEIACLVWASALLDLVYDFIKFNEKAPFNIPQMRFVHAALANSNEVDGVKKSYLIEEVINGKFIKYINNDSPELLPMENQDQERRAKFLAFAQHVQYFKTESVFISDLQGGDTLLTDPQITTDP
ncbi:hypothetical protein PTI98_009508 [Pleurotus ostreatus]|nr:hypothetical protein PTI98_009508 [Pleurotus ostreatus]